MKCRIRFDRNPQSIPTLPKMPKARETAVILCRELTLADGNAPEWIHVLPLGPEIEGRDGRKFRMDDPAAVVALQTEDVLIDEDHESEVGGDTKASGWIPELRVIMQADDAFAAPGIWARTEWTPKGAECVKSREYRYLSPAFNYWIDDAGVVHVAKLSSVALTNRPNLDLTALNHEGQAPEQEKQRMEKEQRIALCSALGLSPDVSADVILHHARELKANAGKVPDGYVPQADLATALNRASVFEAELNAVRAEKRAAEVNSVIDEAIKAGKVAPASRDQYAALCSTDEGLTQVKALFSALPSLGLLETQGKSGAPVAKSAGVSLNDEERAIARALGKTEAEMLAYKKAELNAQEDAV